MKTMVRVLLKWENRFGKFQKIMSPVRAKRLEKELRERGFKTKIKPFLNQSQSVRSK